MWRALVVAPLLFLMGCVSNPTHAGAEVEVLVREPTRATVLTPIWVKARDSKAREIPLEDVQGYTRGVIDVMNSCRKYRSFTVEGDTIADTYICLDTKEIGDPKVIEVE